MSEKSKNRKKELEDFLRYSQDQMSEEERNAFERSLQQDPFDAEALEGLSLITPEEASVDLAGLKDQIQMRTARQSQTKLNTRTMWYRIAAAVAVLLVVTSVLFTLFSDRMGQLDRKVAESPEAEKEAAAPASPAERTQVEPSDEITPVKSKVEGVEAEAPEKKAEPEVESEIITKEIIEEELAREELADIQIEEAEEVEVAELAVEEDIHVDEVAAPAMAMDRQAVAKSRKRETVEQLQMAGAAAAEQRTISGVVISGEDEQPIPGVIVAVKGSTEGTVTDLEGKFQISLEDDSQNTLIAQFIGMEQKEISILDQEELLITLEPDAISLEEVVVIATAPKTIAQPTGYSVALIESDADQNKSDYRSATPVGGKKDFNEYIKSNMRFPEHDDDLTKAVVVLNFVVGYDGRPTQVLVLKSTGKAFSDEAIRLLLEGPDWQPAEVEGVKIEQATRIRIVFKKG
ncbi:MAG: carboxypeptidase-like regulatory domain-containing protein [Bacteroidales bacterium]|nr:carboxypeptidase-like regulatory domain-containing protein [Bacteroidales bacterium]